MRELWHYSGNNGYPGETLCDLPAFAPGVAPFDDTCLIDLGDKLSNNDFQQATSDLAEYLHLATATPVSALLERCRAASRPAEHLETAEMTVRSFGIFRLTTSIGLSPLVEDCQTTLTEAKSCWERATPRIGAYGARRAIVISPTEPVGGVLREVLGPGPWPSPSVIIDPRSEPMLCCEIEGVQLSGVAARLIENRPDYARLAGRLLSRVDVGW